MNAIVLVFQKQHSGTSVHAQNGVCYSRSGWFSAKGDLFSRGHLVALLPLGGTGRHSGGHTGQRREDATASSGRRPRMLLSALQRTGQPLTMKNEPMSTVLWFKKSSL